MSKLLKYKNLFNKQVKVHCVDGSTVSGYWSDWISEADNEPDGECIIVDLSSGVPCGISVDEILRIEEG